MLALVTGVACVAIGIFHFSLGIASVPGEGSAGATVDSRERFYGAIFLGYGLAWVYAVRLEHDRLLLIRWLAGIFLLGGVGRLLSLAVHGPPQWFHVALTVIEVVLPLVFFWLGSDSRATASQSSSANGAGVYVSSRVGFGTCARSR